jgi:general secretion pathway protein D
MKNVVRFFIILTTLLCLNMSVAQPPPPSLSPPPLIPAETQGTPKVWNLQEADILSVINEISQETGKNFVIDPRVQGKISLISSKPIKSEDAYDVFLSILELLGYSAIPSGNVIKIVPNIESAELASRVANAKSPGKGDEVVVRVIPLEHVSANQLITVLRPLLPQWSNIAAYTPGNVLIIVGRAANLKRISEIIRNVDKVSDNNVEVIALHQASATQVVSVINNLQNATRTTGEMPSVFVAADERSNSILLSGNKAGRLRMRVLISQLDSPGAGTQDNTEVVYLRYLTAAKFAPILGKIAQQLLGKGESKEAIASLQGSLPSSLRSAENGDMGATLNQAKSKEAAPPENLTNIQAEPSTNALIIIAPPTLMHALNSIIAKLDIRPAQVLVEAIIVEISQNNLKNLGIQWGSRTPTPSVNASDNAANPTPPSTGSLTDFPPLGANVVGIIPHVQLRAILNVLENNTGVDILSTPSVVVLDNHKATLEIGQDIPEQTGSYATTGSTTTVSPFNTVGRKPVTLKLIVIPQINLGNSVRLAIGLTNDSLENPQNPGLNPIIDTSKINNSVIVDTGDILVVGGLIRNNVIENIIKVPILGDIPILGKLFQNKSRSMEKRNLMVFIKPIILHNSEDSSSITYHKYDLIRNKQMSWPEDLSKTGMQKQTNILPLWKSNITLPVPFES